MSGVTSRTLRHYHQLGLLPPARTGPNGYRWYDQPQLLRLQQILLLRELGLGLPEIRRVVDGDELPVDVLRRHSRRLAAQRRRLDRLAHTVQETITQLEGGAPVQPE